MFPENWFFNYKAQWMAFVVISGINATVSVYDSPSSSFLLSFIGFTVITIVISLGLSILIRSFKRDFDIMQFINIALLLSFISLTTEVISFALNFVRGES